MGKKLSLILGAMALLAFAIPSFASAHAITSSPGVLAPVGTTIVGTSTNVETTNTPVGTLRCKHVKVTGIITQNNGSEVDVSDDTTGTTEGCAVDGTPLTIKNPTLTTLVAGVKAGTTFVTLDFTVEVGKVVCELTNVSSTSVPFTIVNSDTINIAGTLKDPKRANCLTAEIHGDLTITSEGTPLILD